MSHVAVFQKKILKQIDSLPKFEKFGTENKVRFFETNTCVSLAEIRGFLHDWKVIQSQAAQPQR